MRGTHRGKKIRISALAKNPHHVLGPLGRTDDRIKKSFEGVKFEIAPFNILKGKISSS